MVRGRRERRRGGKRMAVRAKRKKVVREVRGEPEPRLRSV
jgi:hypothetical protein